MAQTETTVNFYTTQVGVINYEEYNEPTPFQIARAEAEMKRGGIGHIPPKSKDVTLTVEIRLTSYGDAADMTEKEIGMLVMQKLIETNY